ncbi:MAG: hypothetical protein K2R98_29965 [Gemmataceae bacterium]|nr:hypothetical protein [Gemmataceae bacterium]
MIARLIGTCGFLLFFGSLTVPAHAFVSVPEIDPGSATSALTLLAGGMLILTSRCRRK